VKHPIGQTRNGILVYVDLIGSQAAGHIALQPQLLALAKEMLDKTVAKGVEVTIEYDMGRLIGYGNVVKTTDKDTIFYGRAPDDDVYTRFTKNGKPDATPYLTATLRRGSDGGYELKDIWIGHLSPPRPGSANETSESKSYWSNHAFVLDGRPLQMQTITKVCPY
jgi:hypothetical protein